MTQPILNEKAHIESLMRLEKYLIANFPEEMTEGEFLVDAAIRILSRFKNQNTVKTAADIVFGGRRIGMR